MLARAFGAFVVAALVVASENAFAQSGVVPEQIPVNSSETGTPRTKPLPWHDSSIAWEQRVTTQSVGVGESYLSADPYYDWVFYVRPRYYFWEDARSSLSLRAQGELLYEFTNSDVTTENHELLLEDTIVSLAPQHAFYVNGEYLTDLTLSLPSVVLPTSKASADAGKIAQVGVRAFLLQDFPLRENQDWLARGHVGLRAGYAYQFARSVVPELSTLDQLRMDLSGHSVSNDQLAGAAFAEHSALLHAFAGADLYRDVVGFGAEFGVDPMWKFPLQANAAFNAPTGAYVPLEPTNPQRLNVITVFDAYVEVRLLRNALRTSVGYENITSQLRPDSTYRDPLWSPDAKFYLRLDFQPDLLLEPPVPTAPRAGPGPGRNVASVH